MPAYDFSCTADPTHRKDNITFGIHEYAEKTLKDKPCEEQLLIGENFESCPGTYEHTFENAVQGRAFRGPGWTQKFYP